MLKPILFSTPMVQAILDGRKTMTRRIVKGLPENQEGCDLGIIKSSDGTLTGYGFGKMPYQPGDILWVQETWKAHDLNSPAFCMMIKYKADDSTNLQVEFAPSRFDKFEKFYYKNGWQSPYFMPREAARLFLRVKNIRVERLQDITEEDAVKEGIIRSNEHHKAMADAFLLMEFEELWNSTVNKSELDKYGWNASPWVWVVEFEKVDKP